MTKAQEIKAAIESVRSGAVASVEVSCPGGSAATATYRRTARGIVREAYGPDGQDYGSRLVARTGG